jgi:hypothetical protein
MKIALVFNGILRSLQYTHLNIKNNILKVLLDADNELTLYCHNYILPDNIKYTNIRNNEKDILIPKTNKTLLPFNYYIEDNQEQIKAELDLSKYRSKGNPWARTKNYNTLDNYILSLYSKYKITQLLQTHYQSGENQYQYEIVIFLRSDVIFNNKLNINYLNDIKKDNDCIIPDFHHWKGGYNDRMFISKPLLGLYYGNYFSKLYEISISKCLHSETINKYLLDIYICNIILKPIYFKRVRANGEIAHLDTTIK